MIETNELKYELTIKNCKKRYYHSRKQAKKDIKRLKRKDGRVLRCYKCHRCERFHLTSQTKRK